MKYIKKIRQMTLTFASPFVLISTHFNKCLETITCAKLFGDNQFKGIIELVYGKKTNAYVRNVIYAMKCAIYERKCKTISTNN